MALDHPDTIRILVFLEEIGIPVSRGRIEGDSFLPGIEVRDGGLMLDSERAFYPGDLLHEAGHIAVTDPAERPTLSEVRDDPGEEMAAIAWSYAAARAIGIDTQVLFHADGYKGEGAALATAFDNGAGPGAPLLQFYGMTAEAHQAEALGLPAYPQMARWLR
ncbi:hypothetical protein [Sphingomonas kyeonggiensis]|uniref:Uncharacterized protein n=1 Tax=Sphingomonas kyeonggiensis TaxID=1268553 RepID=A0A7W6JS44_9SPHN|nr:hypothetical protein [Sphingomonas kyeonggiensis]MBB4098592.1 hypothetical protein [Sphingomonas kyeonggiensis]